MVDVGRRTKLYGLSKAKVGSGRSSRKPCLTTNSSPTPRVHPKSKDVISSDATCLTILRFFYEGAQPCSSETRGPCDARGACKCQHVPSYSVPFVLSTSSKRGEFQVIWRIPILLSSRFLCISWGRGRDSVPGMVGGFLAIRGVRILSI